MLRKLNLQPIRATSKLLTTHCSRSTLVAPKTFIVHRYSSANNNNSKNEQQTQQNIEDLLQRDFPQFISAKKGSTPIAPEIKLSTVRFANNTFNKSLTICLIAARSIQSELFVA